MGLNKAVQNVCFPPVCFFFLATDNPFASLLHTGADFPESCCAVDVPAAQFVHILKKKKKEEEKVIFSSLHAVFKKQRAKSHKISLYRGSRQQQSALK